MSPSSIPACLGCSPTSPSPTATPATPGYSRSLARVKLLILDDWGPRRSPQIKRAIYSKIVEDRFDKGSIIGSTSQVPVDRWHDLIGIPTLADAILDRVIHNAYRIDLAERASQAPSSS